MNKILKIVIFGLIVWLIPTLVTLLASYVIGIYLFDVISALAIAITVIVFAYLYFKYVNTDYLKEGVVTGIVWLLISLVLDIALVFLQITKLTLMEYLIYVSPLYIIIPAITIGFGLYKGQMSENITE